MLFWRLRWPGSIWMPALRYCDDDLKTFVILAACLALAACGRGADEAAKPAPSSAERRRGRAHKEDPNTVEVDEGMLRDLRITTRTVESRTGGELVMLLGELAVDQRAYAEVGAPVAARVTRLLVNAGDAVRRGQTLAELTSPELGRERAEYLSAQRAAHAGRSRARAQAWPGGGEDCAAPGGAGGRIGGRRSPRRTSRRPAPRSPHSASSRQRTMVTLRRRRRSCCVHRLQGSVIERTAVVGQMLDPAAPAFRIGNLSTLWLTVHAFERDAVRIQQGVAARLSFPALPGQDFAGTVTMVGRQVERESRTVPVRIDVQEQGQLSSPRHVGDRDAASRRDRRTAS